MWLGSTPSPSRHRGSDERRWTLRFSEIVAEFFQIALAPEHAELADVAFSLAVHHGVRFSEGTLLSVASQFHFSRHVAAVHLMLETVYMHGDFTRAQDPSLKGFESRASWRPELLRLPDEDMFSGLKADPLYPRGSGHPLDFYLTSEPSFEVVWRVDVKAS